MKHKLQQLISNACFWLLRKCGCRVPVVRPVNITPRDMQRVRVQETISYHMLDNTRPDVRQLIERRVREAMAEKLAEICEVRQETTPEGMRFCCDMLACNYPIVPEP